MKSKKKLKDELKNTETAKEMNVEDTTIGEESGDTAACQVRRRIEDYLEKRRYVDELGEFDEDLEFVD
ncbi:MAG TPA: hypothetical protein VI844_03515 [Coxiellaceae bacterium]|nr:hypothetical protein [Coxiellaceae bacterium]